MAEHARLRDVYPAHAVLQVRGPNRRRQARGAGLGRSDRPRPSPPGGGSEGRHSHHAARHAPRRGLARPDCDRRLNMDLARFERVSAQQWRIPRHGAMRVPGVIYGSKELVAAMDDKVYEQLVNVAALPGIVDSAYAMPDAHWGYGFPIGGVAAFDPDQGGVMSAGGVGFDISCGVRCLHTGLKSDEILPVQRRLAEMLYQRIPAGLGSTGGIRLSESE